MPIGSIETEAQLLEFIRANGLEDAMTLIRQLQAGMPMARVYRDTTQSIPDQTETAIQFNAVDFDTGGFYDVAHNTRLTARRAGSHLVIANVQFASLGAGTIESYAIVRKNGGGAGTSVGPFESEVNTDATADPGYSLSGMTMELDVGDYLECYAYQDNSGGSAVNVQFIAGRSPVFTIAWLGAVGAV